ncbi:MAG: hypothetical protein VB934_07505, partial [Polyangiaceae bacterium]
AEKLNESTKASKNFAAALEERPDDRRVLTRLMRLYSEEKDWGKLVDVVLKLAEGVEDTAQKAKYIQTAAIVCARQLEDYDQALRHLDQVFELDPGNANALSEAIGVRESMEDYEGMLELLDRAFERAAGDAAEQLKLLERKANLYADKLDRPAEAITTLETLQQLDPDNAERTARLLGMYTANLEVHLDKAVALHMASIHRDPFDATPYRTLRRIFTECKDADAAWCLCQALYCMSSAEPDEERFFRRMRAETAANAQERLSDEDWIHTLMHPWLDPLVTAVFQLVQPAIISRNSQPLEQLGYQEAFALDLATHPYPMSKTLYYAGGVLDMELPPCFQNPNDGGGISFLHTQRPSIVLGAAALAAELPTQAGAFIAARHLTYYRAGLYIRHLVPTGTGLRTWLFAAIRLIHDTFPVAQELESTVSENLDAIRGHVRGPARDQLASAVTKLLQSGAIDLKRWVAAVDLTADRVGFLVCHDLEIANEMVRASDEASAALGHRDRIRELSLFSVGPEYFALRKRLGIGIES